MSLERRDVRVKLDYEIHQALLRLCERTGMDPARYAEQILVRALKKKVHEAIINYDALKDTVLAGNIRDMSGKSQK